LVRDANFEVPISKAMPGWSGYVGGGQIGGVAYNTVGIGGAVISFHDSTSLFPPIQGNYSVRLQPSSVPPTSVAISQTGLIPQGAQSLQFFSLASAFQVTFAGQAIPLVRIGATTRYDIFGGDISAFSGMSGELRFTGGGALDNIYFSDQAIPEPSVACLVTLGAGLLAWLGRKRTRA
jgi:PEP-CTERM motif-containing protein